MSMGFEQKDMDEEVLTDVYKDIVMKYCLKKILSISW